MIMRWSVFAIVGLGGDRKGELKVGSQWKDLRIVKKL